MKLTTVEFRIEHRIKACKGWWHAPGKAPQGDCFRTVPRRNYPFTKPMFLRAVKRAAQMKKKFGDKNVRIVYTETTTTIKYL